MTDNSRAIILTTILLFCAANAPAQTYTFEYGMSYKGALEKARSDAKEALTARIRQLQQERVAEEDRLWDVYYDKSRVMTDPIHLREVKQETRIEIRKLRATYRHMMDQVKEQAKVDLAFREAQVRRNYGMEDGEEPREKKF